MARLHPLIWTNPALDDLDEIATWIAADNEAAARRLVANVFEKVERLARFPNSGRRAPELPGTPYREVLVRPCRVFYRLDGKSVLIVHVMRGERLLDPRRFD